jgi:hypothetical protein
LLGIASAAPGIGLTSSGVFASCADASRLAGRHLGEIGAVVACAVLASAVAAQVSAMSVSPRSAPELPLMRD